MVAEELLTAQIRALETQLAVLKAQIRHLGTETSEKSFADLYGLLAGKACSSEEAIDAVTYRFEWEDTEEK